VKGTPENVKKTKQAEEEIKQQIEELKISGGSAEKSEADRKIGVQSQVESSMYSRMATRKRKRDYFEQSQTQSYY
jgi:hypothetical protein